MDEPTPRPDLYALLIDTRLAFPESEKWTEKKKQSIKQQVWRLRKYLKGVPEEEIFNLWDERKGYLIPFTYLQINEKEGRFELVAPGTWTETFAQLLASFVKLHKR